MYTITINTKRNLLLLAALLLTWGGGSMSAQEQPVTPLHQTKLNPLLAEVFVYAAGGSAANGNLWTANNNVSSRDFKMYGTYADTGLGVEIYKNRQKWLRLGGSIGYKYEVYGYDKSLSDNSGIYSHWLSADLNLNASLLCAGVRSDIFLSSHIKNSDHFTYEGLYSGCFNRMSFCYYVGGNLRFTRLKLEGRVGAYLKPQFNPDKISYYNIDKTHVDGLYFELRAYYRIFTTGKVHHGLTFFE